MHFDVRLPALSPVSAGPLNHLMIFKLSEQKILARWAPKEQRRPDLRGACLLQLIYARDAANRGVMSRVLRMAGFEVSAESVALPFGRVPNARPLERSKAEDERKRFSRRAEQ